MPGQRSPPASCKDPEAIVEAGSNLAKPKLRHSSSGKVKCKWYTVKPPAYFRNLLADLVYGVRSALKIERDQ